ncbi:MAG: M14 family zinc carboxypeptidase [Bacteroidota bacterium]
MSAPTQSQLAHELFDSYDSYKVADITSRRFTQADLYRWLAPLKTKKVFEQSTVGTSAEGRSLSLLTVGKGSTKVFLWSQMHGDEPTATMALVDMLNFFALNPSHAVTTTIRDNLTLLILPMVNPDGAERFQRRTAQQIDMNRDALSLVTPEARILKELRDRYQPEFGFNLHDQEPRYTVGSTKDITAIALLAPAIDESRADNAVRLRAKHVGSVVAGIMNQFIAGHVSKYDDTFEPRAFGDNIQRWGTSTVLIESGGWPDDRDKMFLRKLNCVALLTTLVSIANQSYEKSDISVYEGIPFNTKYRYDLIIRNAQLKSSNKAVPVRVDVGINFEEERTQDGRITLIGKIVDIGDLRIYGSFEEIDTQGAVLDPARIGMEKSITMEEARALGKQR